MISSQVSISRYTHLFFFIVYAKHYSNRRVINENEGYKLMLFPADNSIAVVKDKQCSVAEHMIVFFSSSN